MRQKEKEITDKEKIETIIRNSLVCRLGMVEGDRPYVVPVCFGYEENALYVHSATEGRKIEALKNNPAVCFEFDINCEVVKKEKPCKWGMKFQSVVGFGRAVFLEGRDEKRRALDVIMKQYGGAKAVFNEKTVEKTAVIKIEIQSVTGKQSG